MSAWAVLLIVLLLILVGVFPAWPHSRGFGYGPSGMVAVLLIVCLLILLMGRL